jgi:hypothetical protein
MATCEEDLEDLESIRAYDAATSSGDEVIPFEQALEELTGPKSSLEIAPTPAAPAAG